MRPYIYTGPDLALLHVNESADEPVIVHEENGSDSETLREIYEAMTEKEKEVVHYMIGAALEHAETGGDNADKGVTAQAISTTPTSGADDTDNATDADKGRR